MLQPQVAALAFHPLSTFVAPRMYEYFIYYRRVEGTHHEHAFTCSIPWIRKIVGEEEPG